MKLFRACKWVVLEFFICNHCPNNAPLYLRQKRGGDEGVDGDLFTLSEDEKYNILSDVLDVKILGMSYKNIFNTANDYLNDSICLFINDPPYGMFYIFFIAS